MSMKNPILVRSFLEGNLLMLYLEHHVENVPVMYDFSNLPAKELNMHVKDDQTFGTSDGAAADESTLQLSVPGTECSVDNHFNDIEVEQMSSTKKKRKTNTNTAIIEEPNKATPPKKTPLKKPKLKKSKSESKILISE